jgi:predicted LPLAT superfamily acyltransferase
VSETRAWQQIAEVGSLGALRAMAALYRLFGRRFSVLVLYPVSAFYFLRHRYIREASRDYLRTLGAPAGPRDVFAHIFEFAVQIFDRMVSWGDSFDRMEMEKGRSVALLELARSGRGGILVGAHLGSFDLLRLVADRYAVRVNVLMYTAHADRINQFFARLDPRSRVRVLAIDPESVQTAFAVRRCIEQGEFVGILADRVPPGGRARTERVPFLGREAAFPLAPFELAALLGCPLLLCLCLRTGDARYEAIAHTLYEGGRLPAGARPTRARALLSDYVRELEAWCRRVPQQWFNFYDFWALAGAGPALGAPGAPPPAGAPGLGLPPADPARSAPDSAS